uniref:Chondroitin proteoglycan 4 domain-containing protein n=1 Tax=Panagrolaimus sp. JU765 TaxID=591449 RepID=A0AC34Q9A3_9BILA
MAIILGFWESVEAKCLNLCTDNFKTSMVQILGGSSHSEAELLAPFHSIIAKSRTNSAANRKVEWICFAVKKFDECANKCPANNAKTMRMASILQWNTICNESKQNSKAFAEFVSCERHHIDKTSKKCHFMKVNEQMPLKDFCKQLVGYSHCYASVPFECSTRATEVWLRLNHAIQKSFNVLLQLSAQHLRLPNECELTMATTLPAGILSTASPILSTVSTTTTTEMPPETTTTPSPTPLYHDDKSTADDYTGARLRRRRPIRRIVDRIDSRNRRCRPSHGIHGFVGSVGGSAKFRDLNHGFALTRCLLRALK